MKVIVLGAGLVGTPMALDLSKDSQFEVTVADLSQEALDRLRIRDPSISTIQLDLSNSSKIASLVKDHDFVLNAVPGFLGFQTLTAIIKAKRNVVDIAFCP